MIGWDWLLAGIVVGLVLGVLVGYLVGNGLAWRQKPARYQALVENLKAEIEGLHTELATAQQAYEQQDEILHFGWKEDKEIAKILLDNLHAITEAMGETPQYRRLIRWAARNAPE